MHQNLKMVMENAAGHRVAPLDSSQNETLCDFDGGAYLKVGEHLHGITAKKR